TRLRSGAQFDGDGTHRGRRRLCDAAGVTRQPRRSPHHRRPGPARSLEHRRRNGWTLASIRARRSCTSAAERRPSKRGGLGGRCSGCQRAVSRGKRSSAAGRRGVEEGQALAPGADRAERHSRNSIQDGVSAGIPVSPEPVHDGAAVRAPAALLSHEPRTHIDRLRRKSRMKRVAILQSSYIPWKGYFDLMRQVDEFILYDDAQFTKRDWRNRNQIKTKDGLLWLT